MTTVMKRQVVRACIAIIAGIVLVGCASTAQLNTQSGRAEATISAEKTVVKAELLNRAVTNGWKITRETDSMVTVEKANPDFLSNALLASRWDPQTELRIEYTLIESGNATRILADPSIITNAGTGLERSMAITNNQVNEGIRLELENIKVYIEYHTKKMT